LSATARRQAAGLPRRSEMRVRGMDDNSVERDALNIEAGLSLQNAIDDDISDLQSK
jgi:hypothetical protein